MIMQKLIRWCCFKTSYLFERKAYKNIENTNIFRNVVE